MKYMFGEMQGLRHEIESLESAMSQVLGTSRCGSGFQIGVSIQEMQARGLPRPDV